MDAKFTMTEVVGTGADNVARIRVIGVGGGGGNMINHIIREGIAEQNGLKTNDLIVANTDLKALEVSESQYRIQLGRKKTSGRGAGMRPEVGEESAKESTDDIRTQLEGSNIVFVAAGLGGGTGTGAAPVVASIAKSIGALTIGVVTLPFEFEGRMRAKLATQGLHNLKEICDNVIVVPNQKLLGFVGDMCYTESFKIVDDVLAKAVSGMCSIVLKSSTRGINTDFADLETAMSFKGESLIGVGEATGDRAAQEAVRNSMQSPLLEGMSIKGAKAFLINFTFNPYKTPTQDINEATEYVNRMIDSEANDDVYVFFGTATDESLENGKVCVTLVATGISGNEAYTKIEQVQEKPAPKPENRYESSFLSRYRRTAGGYDIREDDDLDAPVIARYRQD